MAPLFYQLLRKSNFILIAALLFSGCKSIPVDRSAYASQARLKTALLGGCGSEVSIGWKACQVEEGSQIPPLTIYFMHQGNYAVSGCDLELFSSGSVEGPGPVTIDMSLLTARATQLGFCFIKIETEERWEEQRRIPLSGGFIVEVYQRGYLPTPPREDLAFCYKVARTTSGRTTMEKCR